MRLRPQPPFLRVMKQAEPDHATKNKLIYKFKHDGVKGFEPEFLNKFSDVSIVQPISCLPPADYEEDPKEDAAKTPRGSGQTTRWVYVGDGWWCRSIKQKSTKYQFAQLMAVFNEGDCTRVEGPWDASKHVVEPPAEIVYSKDGKPGRIVGYDLSGVQVSWLDEKGVGGIPVTVSSFDDLSFEFQEDRIKYRRIMAGRRKYDGKP